MVVNAPPSILYCTVNSATGVTVGKINADAQVLVGAVNTGAEGNMTTFTVLLFPHAAVPAVPAGTPTHAFVVTYLAMMV